VAYARNVYENRPGKPIQADNSMVCSLQILNGISGIGANKANQDSVETILKGSGSEAAVRWGGNYVHATLATIYDYEKPYGGYNSPGMKADHDFLISKGFIDLGTFQGGHGDYRMRLYAFGLTPNEEKKK
jgi:hypothetical protein